MKTLPDRGLQLPHSKALRELLTAQAKEQAPARLKGGLVMVKAKVEPAARPKSGLAEALAEFLHRQRG